MGWKIDIHQSEQELPSLLIPPEVVKSGPEFFHRSKARGAEVLVATVKDEEVRGIDLPGIAGVTQGREYYNVFEGLDSYGRPIVQYKERYEEEVLGKEEMNDPVKKKQMERNCLATARNRFRREHEGSKAVIKNWINIYNEEDFEAKLDPELSKHNAYILTVRRK